MISLYIKTRTTFKVFYPPDSYYLDFQIIKKQQSQGPLVKTLYQWHNHNAKPENIAPSIAGTPV